MWTGDLVADHSVWTSGHVTWSTSLCKPCWNCMHANVPDGGKGGSLWAGLCAHFNFPTGISESIIAFQPQDPAQLSFRESLLPFSTRWFEKLTHSPRGCMILSQYLGKVHQPRGSWGYFSDGAECESQVHAVLCNSIPGLLNSFLSCSNTLFSISILPSLSSI